MRMRQALVWILSAAPLTACLSENVDSGAAKGPQRTSLTAIALPPGQCPTGSAECFELCGSPSCALPDGAIPPNLGTPVIYQADGRTTANPCDAVEQESLAVREASCAPCHGSSSAGFASLNFILDDAKLVASASSYQDDAGKPKRLVIPGDPEHSWIYQRIMSRQMPPANPSSYIGPEAGSGVVTPSAADISILYGWILNCVAGADGGAYAASYYGGNYGASGDGAVGTGLGDGASANSGGSSGGSGSSGSSSGSSSGDGSVVDAGSADGGASVRDGGRFGG